MAADAQYRGVELFGFHVGRTVSVLGQRSMAGLAIYMGVLSVFLLFEDVTVTALAGLMSGEVDRACRDIRERFAPVMAVLSKAGRDKKSPDHQEQHDSRQKDRRKTEKMACISEEAVHNRAGQGIQEGGPSRCADDH